MRRLALLAVLAGLAGWLLRRKQERRSANIVIGYDDGSSIELHSGTPEATRLVGVAAQAVGR